MRMWNVPTDCLCRKHLLGEHLESHKFVGAINKKKNISGFINSGLVETHKLHSRHEALSREMKRRGYKHNSKLPKFNISTMRNSIHGFVNVSRSLMDLSMRCKECRKRIERKMK